MTGRAWRWLTRREQVEEAREQLAESERQLAQVRRRAPFINRITRIAFAVDERNNLAPLMKAALRSHRGE